MTIDPREGLFLCRIVEKRQNLSLLFALLGFGALWSPLKQSLSKRQPVCSTEATQNLGVGRGSWVTPWRSSGHRTLVHYVRNFCKPGQKGNRVPVATTKPQGSLHSVTLWELKAAGNWKMGRTRWFWWLFVMWRVNLVSKAPLVLPCGLFLTFPRWMWNPVEERASGILVPSWGLGFNVWLFCSWIFNLQVFWRSHKLRML